MILPENNWRNPLLIVTINDMDHEDQYVIWSKCLGNLAGSIWPIDSIAGNKIDPVVTIKRNIS